jgi:predicted nucleic acid-binding Zn ribbon protein
VPGRDSAEDPKGSGDSIGSVIRDVLGRPELRRGLALGRLARAWEGVVGGRLAAETTPRAVEGEALVVAVSAAAWAAQVRFLGPQIARRASEMLGAEKVTSVRVVIDPRARKPLPPKGSGAP